MGESGKSGAWQNNKLTAGALQAAVFDTHNPGSVFGSRAFAAGDPLLGVRRRVFQG